MLRFVVPLALAAVLTGCGSEEPSTPAADPASTPAADPTTTAATEPTSTPAPRQVVIEPGAIGEARVGMTRAEWEPTGLFEDGAAVCEGELVHWTGNPPGYSVLTDDDATITQLSVSRPGPATKHGGIHVGSTYADLTAAFPTLTDPVDDGFDQASAYPPGEEDGRAYLGFLLDAPAAQVTAETLVVSIAVTGGEKPYFQYDC